MARTKPKQITEIRIDPKSRYIFQLRNVTTEEAKAFKEQLKGWWESDQPFIIVFGENLTIKEIKPDESIHQP